MAAFIPVDEENTRIYLRFCQNIVRVPFFRLLVNKFGNVMDRVVLHQDRRLVLTQIPKKSELQMDENLVQGDLPVIEYCRKRQELKEHVDNNTAY
jgi:hypothetical protein